MLLHTNRYCDKYENFYENSYEYVTYDISLIIIITAFIGKQLISIKISIKPV